MIINDCRPRAPVRSRTDHSETVCNLLYTPFNDHRLQEIQAATLLHPVLNQLKITILQGWPDHKDSVPTAVLPYFSYRDELTVQDGIILRGDRIVIPQSLRQDLKIKVHAGHQGVNSCLRRARDLIFWPGMSADIRAYVESCDTCARGMGTGKEKKILKSRYKATIVGGQRDTRKYNIFHPENAIPRPFNLLIDLHYWLISR